MTMRYFLAAFVLLCLVVVSIAGFRGGISRRPPIELFPDMDRQPKLRPQSANEFFADRFSSRLHPANTIPRSQSVVVGETAVYPFDDHPLNTGMVAGTPPGATNFVELNPLPINAELLARGRDVYSIHCQLCHGAAGDGKGVTTKYGMVVIANLHDPRLVRMTDGEIFNTVTHGKNLMQGYAATIVPRDRWAAIAYVRALQLSHLATADEVPADQQAALRK
jgi:mono/diheme cytochrome c family protein